MRKLFLSMAVVCHLSANAQIIIDVPHSCPHTDTCMVRAMYSTVFQNKIVTISDYSPTMNAYKLWSIDSVFNFALHDAGANVTVDFTPAGDPPHNKMVVAGNRLFFQMSSPATGLELYSWNGSADSPKLAWDIVPGTGNGFSPQGNDMVVYNDKVYLNSAGKLYVFDPVTNTGSLAFSLTLGSGPIQVDPINMTVFNNKIYFVSNQDSRLYVYDPVANNGYQVPGFTNFVSQSRFIEAGGKLYFTARYNIGIGATTQLCSIDTANTVTRLTGLYGGISTQNSCPSIGLMNGKLYFIASDSFGHGLWEDDIATNTLTRKTSTYYPEFPGFKVANNKLYFNNNDSVHGTELWVYDGVNAPHMVQDLATGVQSSTPTHMVVYNNVLFFYAYRGPHELRMVLDTSILSVNNIKTGPTYQLYPNPGEGRFTLKGNIADDKALSIEVMNMQGQVIYHDVVIPVSKEFNKQIDLTHEAKGIYLVRVSNEADTRILRLVLE